MTYHCDNMTMSIIQAVGSQCIEYLQYLTVPYSSLQFLTVLSVTSSLLDITIFMCAAVSSSFRSFLCWRPSGILSQWLGHWNAQRHQAFFGENLYACWFTLSSWSVFSIRSISSMLGQLLVTWNLDNKIICTQHIAIISARLACGCLKICTLMYVA